VLGGFFLSDGHGQFLAFCGCWRKIDSSRSSSRPLLIFLFSERGSLPGSALVPQIVTRVGNENGGPGPATSGGLAGSEKRVANPSLGGVWPMTQFFYQTARLVFFGFTFDRDALAYRWVFGPPMDRISTSTSDLARPQRGRSGSCAGRSPKPVEGDAAARGGYSLP